MATTFATAYAALMSMINRPTSETTVLAAAKLEINNAISYLQRNHSFVYAERISEVSITANAQYVSMAAPATGTILRSVLSMQQLSATGALEGKPLKVKSFAQLQADRGRYLARYPAGDTAVYDGLTDFTDVFSIEEAYRSDKIGFVMGQNIGLYPRQATAVPLLLHYSTWLAALSADGDTNFFLDYALDVVLMLAARRMHIYLKADNRYSVSKEEADANIATLIAWDSQLRETPMTSIA